MRATVIGRGFLAVIACIERAKINDVTFLLFEAGFAVEKIPFRVNIVKAFFCDAGVADVFVIVLIVISPTTIIVDDVEGARDADDSRD